MPPFEADLHAWFGGRNDSIHLCRTFTQLDTQMTIVPSPPAVQVNEPWLNFLGNQGLRPDGSDFGDVGAELRAARDGAVVAPLLNLGLIRANGPDAADFLHNLVTNDIKGLTPGMVRLAGLCTPKGRLLASLQIFRDGDGLLLILPRDVLPAILKRLSMYILRSKVKLSDASAECVLIAFSSPGTVSPPPTFAHALPMDTGRWLLALSPEAAIIAWPELIRVAKPVGLLAWQWLDIAAGQPRVVAATQEAFIPQMLNMELPAVAGVSFTKGCYPGQEIVARTQYLGKVKRRMVRARLAMPALPGTHVFAPETGDQHCGAVVSAGPAPDGSIEALVCVQLGAVEAGEVHVGAPDGPTVEFLPLPYTLGA
jgi:folate-binding protein YgfZ